MMLRSPRQDPVLEIKREGYLAIEKAACDNLLETYKVSISKTKLLHANLLFTTCSGFSILTGICRLITFIEPSVRNVSWRDLAVRLGYTDVDIKCINNLRGSVYDPTELALRYYASTKKDATVGDILQALLDLELLPALHQAQKHIDNFLAEVESEKADVILAPVNTKENEKKNILKAANFKPSVPAIFDELPSKDINTVGTDPIYNSKEEDTIQRTRPPARTKQSKQYCKLVMLSFASDGHATALKIASVLRGMKNKRGASIGVLMLCENDDQIQGNAGQMIPDILSKVDFVIPVLTEGYFSALEQPNPRARLLDERYIQFVHNILVSKYILNNCINLNVRSVIPSQELDNVCYKPVFIHNSIFSAWKSDDEIDILAHSILKSRRKK